MLNDTHTGRLNGLPSAFRDIAVQSILKFSTAHFSKKSVQYNVDSVHKSLDFQICSTVHSVQYECTKETYDVWDTVLDFRHPLISVNSFLWLVLVL